MESSESFSQRIVFGENAITQLGDLCQGLGASRVLLITDPGLIQAGHCEKALQSLAKANITSFLFDQVEENPSTRHVGLGLEFAQKHSPIDCIVALGGGSPMDCAKGINFLLTNGGEMEDYWGIDKASQPMLPSIGIPTTAGTGSESQRFALITQEKDHQKMACGDSKALFRTVILDPILTQTLPQNVTATAGLDAIAHALESYVSTERTQLSQILAREAWRLLNRNFEMVIESPDDLGSRAEMLWGAHFAGAAIENSMLGAAHACANPLTIKFGITHGIAVSLMLPHVIRFNGDKVDKLYSELLETAGLPHETPAEQLSGRVTYLINSAELPTILREYQVEKASLPDLAHLATQQWTGKFNPKSLSEANFLSLYEEAY